MLSFKKEAKTKQSKDGKVNIKEISEEIKKNTKKFQLLAFASLLISCGNFLVFFFSFFLVSRFLLFLASYILASPLNQFSLAL